MHMQASMHIHRQGCAGTDRPAHRYADTCNMYACTQPQVRARTHAHPCKWANTSAHHVRKQHACPLAGVHLHLHIYTCAGAGPHLHALLGGAGKHSRVQAHARTTLTGTLMQEHLWTRVCGCTQSCSRACTCKLSRSQACMQAHAVTLVGACVGVQARSHGGTLVGMHAHAGMHAQAHIRISLHKLTCMHKRTYTSTHEHIHMCIPVHTFWKNKKVSRSIQNEFKSFFSVFKIYKKS